jgi:hypothetical protein
LPFMDYHAFRLSIFFSFKAHSSNYNNKCVVLKRKTDGSILTRSRSCYWMLFPLCLEQVPHPLLMSIDSASMWHKHTICNTQGRQFLIC